LGYEISAEEVPRGTKWFGKCGISWHITVAIRKTEDEKMQVLTFVHVCEKWMVHGQAKNYSVDQSSKYVMLFIEIVI
jgi:hypothetical protein